MPYTYVISGLKEKRIQLVSQIEALQAQLRQAFTDLDHVEAALALFDPDFDFDCPPARRIAPAWGDTKRDSGRIILETLRHAAKPLLTEQICQAVMVAR